MSEAAGTLLTDWLERQLSETQATWLAEQLAKLSSGADRDLHVLFGLAPRRLGRADLSLSQDDLAAAQAVRKDWDPRGWTIDEAARVLGVLKFASEPDRFTRIYGELCRTAEVGESVALYRGLPLYPGSQQLEWQVGEGLRTSMRAVFEAIAHRNPYPKENFSEERWNHMVLKALFIGSSLHPIQGLDERANPVLAEILRDYAHERWAAGRPVTPELWRCMGPFAEGAMIDDLIRLSRSDDGRERGAAALALAASRDRRAAELLETLPVEAMAVKAGRLSWDSLNAQ